MPTIPSPGTFCSVLSGLLLCLIIESCNNGSLGDKKVDTPPVPTFKKTLYIRKNASEPAAAADIAALERAMRKMRAAPCGSPLSWYYQAAIHSVPMSVANSDPLCPSYLTVADLKPAWMDCTHDAMHPELHFLLWHRLFIWYFERIVRKLSGKTDFALPYWDYTNANYRVMPAAFRDSNSALFEPARLPDLNKGNPIGSEMDGALDMTADDAWTTYEDFNENIDNSPHGAMHEYIGGADDGYSTFNNIYQATTSGLMAEVPSAAYNPEHPDYAKVADYARKTVELIDTRFPGIPFPYPHITVVNGLDAMEYPMMVNDLPFKEPADAIEFTAHEVFHSLFPFYVGTNETKYSFMDEGLATMVEFTLHQMIDSTVPVGNNTGDVNKSAGTEQDLPIITLTPQLIGAARYADKDMKPALGFYYIREMLGEEKFNQALRYFIEKWAGKHPTPYDFFQCMNTGAGQDLNWFWDNWFFHKYVPDLAISKVDNAKITIQRKGEGMVPIHLTVKYANGETKHITKTIACWAHGNRQITIPMKKGFQSIDLGAPFDADSDPGNNHWRAN